MRYMPSVFAVVAIWLMAAPFLLGYADSTMAVRDNVTVGSVMLLAAALWGIHELKEHGWSAHVLKKEGQQGRTT